MLLSREGSTIDVHNRMRCVLMSSKKNRVSGLLPFHSRAPQRWRARSANLFVLVRIVLPDNVIARPQLQQYRAELSCELQGREAGHCWQVVSTVADLVVGLENVDELICP